MKTALASYFIKATAVAFVTVVVLAVVAGTALSIYSRTTGARVSDGAFFLQLEDFVWIAAIAVVIGAAATAVRFVRRGG
jgi:hypothetical protein